jgi:hypothetical protein
LQWAPTSLLIPLTQASDENSTVSDTSSNADMDDTASTDNKNSATGVTAIIAKLVNNKADSQSSSGLKRQSKSLKSNLIKVLLDSGSDGDLWFQEKGTKPRFPYLTRQMPKSWHTSNGSFLTKGRGEVNLTFFEYSNSKRYIFKPDIVEYDTRKMAKPAFDLILGVDSLSKLGIVLDFRTKTITVDESINLTTAVKIKKAWSVNNSIMLHEPQSTLDATNRVVGILDAKYEKANLHSVVNEHCKHLLVHDRNKLLDLLKEFEDLFDGTL